MKLVATFFMVFVVGPGLFWRLAYRTPSRHRIAGLMIVAIVLMLAAFGLGRWAVPMLSPSPYPGLGVIVFSWLAWVVVLAYCALALQYRLTSHIARKTILTLGAISTTLPWFGLYAAQVIAEK